MKIKIFLAVLFSVTVIIFASCDNFLDITPEGQVKRSEMLNTTDGIEDALYGVYAQLRQGELYGMALGIYGIEILGQNMDCYGSDFVTNLGSYNWEYSQVREWSEGVWTDMYKCKSGCSSR